MLQATQSAAHWLATLSDESCTEEERQQFLEWLRYSTRHVDEFLRLSTLARGASKRELWPQLTIEELVAAARAHANVEQLNVAAGSKSVRSASRFTRRALAASLAGILTLATLALTNPQLHELFAPAYRTAIGEQRSITLADGSIVQLNSRTRMRTHFTAELRAIELSDGEAIFHVAKEPARAFRVRTGATDIVAVGTAFNVNASEARTIVTVLEGRVSVDHRVPASAASPRVELVVGEQLIVAPSRPMVRLALKDTQKVTAWTQRRLIFEDTPIAAAAAEFARYSPRQIRILDADIGARRISGVFDATDPGSLVEFLRVDETVEVLSDGDHWIVRTRAQALPAAL